MRCTVMGRPTEFTGWPGLDQREARCASLRNDLAESSHRDHAQPRRLCYVEQVSSLAQQWLAVKPSASRRRVHPQIAQIFADEKREAFLAICENLRNLWISFLSIEATQFQKMSHLWLSHPESPIGRNPNYFSPGTSLKQASASGLARASRFLTGRPWRASRTASSTILPLRVRGMSATATIFAGTCRGVVFCRI